MLENILNMYVDNGEGVKRRATSPRKYLVVGIFRSHHFGFVCPRPLRHDLEKKRLLSLFLGGVISYRRCDTAQDMNVVNV